MIQPVLNSKEAVLWGDAVTMLHAYADTVLYLHRQKEQKIAYAQLISSLTSNSASALNSKLDELGLMAYDLILLQIKY